MLSTVNERQAKFRRKSLGRHRSIIPDDKVLIEILKRLPEAKSVIRCKLVCKKWYGIISAASFIRKFLNHNNFAAAADYDKISHFVPQSHTLQPDYFPLFILPPEQLIKQREEDISYRERVARLDRDGYNFTVLASCNDLLLCRLGSETEYCICNPLTKQYTTLPPSPKFIGGEGIRCISYVVGFSCDPYVKKNRQGQVVTLNPDYTYRVVLVINCFKRDGMRIQVFSSETNEWRVINPRFPCDPYVPLPAPVVHMSPMTFCKGMGFYEDWETLHTNKPQICIYNPQNSTLRTILAPPFHAGQLIKPALGDCRGVLRFFRLLVSDVEEEEEEEAIVTAKVWELDCDEQWRLVHNVYLNQLSGFAKTISRRRVLAIAIDPNDADIIYIRVGGNIFNIVSCNLREMEMKHIQGPLVDSCLVLHDSVFPVMAPLWPTPIRLPIPR